MKKSVLAISLMLVFVLVFVSACSSKTTTSPAASDAATVAPTDAPATAAPATDAPADKAVNFTYATFIGDVNTDQVGAAALVYQKAHPNIKITFQTMDHDSYQQKMGIMMDSNTMPDLFWWNGSTLSQALRNTKSIVDLTPYFDDAFKATFIGSAFDFLNLDDGKIAGFPSEAQVQGFWYNKALFDKFSLTFPKTFDDLLADVKVFKANGIVPIAQGTKDPWPIWAWYMWEEKYGVLEDQEAIYKTRTMKFKDSGFGKTAIALSKLHDAGAFPENSSTMNFDQMTSLFADSKAAIIQLSSDQLGKFQGQPIANDMKFNWGPDFTDTKANQHVAVKTVNNGYAIGANVASDKDKLDAIIAFNKWRYSDEGMDVALKAGFILPVKSGLDFTKYGPLISEQAKALNDDYKGLNMDVQYVLPNYIADTTPLGAFLGPKDALLNAIVDGSVSTAKLPAEFDKLDKLLDSGAGAYKDAPKK